MRRALRRRLSMNDFCEQMRARSQNMDVHAAHLETDAAHLIGELLTAVGGCERIRRTPVPFMYSRHTSRSLTMWCGTLPLVLVETLGMAAVPVMAVLCWCVFGIEEIGHLIEQPFYGRVCALASNCKPVRAEVVLVRC
jgi:predicted membrane chloride channel (bestrophin family)